MDMVARFLARHPDRRKALKDLRRALLHIAIDESKVDGLIAELLSGSGTQI
jgi:hypothetical protein